MKQIATLHEKQLGRVIPSFLTEPREGERVTVIAMVEDNFLYCIEYCRRENCIECSHRDQKCGFPVSFNLKPITIPAEYDGVPDEEDKKYRDWIYDVYKIPRPEWYCGDKPEDYLPTLVTFEQRYDSIIAWLGREGYSYNPNARLKLNKPSGYPATFQNLLEELHNWLLYNRGHTGIDDWIIAISKINYGAPLKFIGSFVGNEHSGLIGRICELYALRADLPSKVKVSEAKKLGYSKSDLLQLGYKEKQFRGTRFMVLASNL